MDTLVESGNRRGRPNYPTEFKHQLAVAACAPGVSVSKLALDHDINTNMLFKWRRELRAGLLTAPVQDAAKLLPIVLKHPPMPAKGANEASSACTIEIVIADAIVRVGADTDAALLRLVFQSLRA